MGEDSEYRVDDKIALVTGAAGGMGQAVCLALAKGGAGIIAVDIKEGLIQETAATVSEFGGRSLAITVDVSKEEQVREAVEQAISQFGKIDILCNTAGIYETSPVVYVPGIKYPGWEFARNSWDKQLTLNDWYRTLDINLTSILLFCQAVGPYMIKQRRGKVINISSISGDCGSPYHAAYCVSKAGVSMLTRVIASEWAQFNINVNAIAPGWTRSPMTKWIFEEPELKKGVISSIPLGRAAEPEDIALLVRFLASEASDFVTGEVINLDGGSMGRGVF
jgi:NAD(P)-dependent dehydrogenase (short-subunit alcohol dehydrogenase family)